LIFDSQAPIGAGQGVYLLAIAEELSGIDLEQGIAVYSRRSQAHGASAWTSADVLAPASHRLYRASASELWILDPTPGQIFEAASGQTGDLRIRVTP
jgi:hypothetical protein